MRRLMAADNTVEKRNVKQKRQFKLQQSAVFVGHDCDFHSFLPEKSKRFAHARKSFDHPRHVGFVKFGIFTVSLFRPAAKHQRKIIHERQQFVLLFAGALPVRQPVFCHNPVNGPQPGGTGFRQSAVPVEHRRLQSAGIQFVHLLLLRIINMKIKQFGKNTRETNRLTAVFCRLRGCLYKVLYIPSFCFIVAGTESRFERKT